MIKIPNKNIYDFIVTVLITIILPNITFYIASLITGANRSLINIDYFIPFLLLSINFYKTASLLFIFFFIIDSIAFSLIFFPFIKAGDLIYLSSFIFSGQTFYLVAFYTIILILILKVILILKTAKKINKSHLFSLLLLTIITNIGVSFFHIKNTTNPYVSSYFYYLYKNKNSSFFDSNGDKSLLKKSPYPNATIPWFNNINNNTIPNHRLLLIVAESWGTMNDNKTQQIILQKLYQQSSSFSFLKTGSSKMLGATVAGEIRELCGSQPQTLNMKLVNRAEFKHCLPQILANRGFKTYALHVAPHTMYERNLWYPLIGFQQSIFFESQKWPRLCHSFGGACDIDANKIIINAFSNLDKRVFFHWMTLNTHANYDKRDILSDRVNCEKIGLVTDSDTCHYVKLHTQFFDNLVDILQNPHMKNVEVIIVGDHPPPMLNFIESVRNFKLEHVSWVHLRTKP